MAVGPALDTAFLAVVGAGQLTVADGVVDCVCCSVSLRVFVAICFVRTSNGKFTFRCGSIHASHSDTIRTHCSFTIVLAVVLAILPIICSHIHFCAVLAFIEMTVRHLFVAVEFV